MTPSTPAPTDAGALADRIDAAHFIKLVGMDRDVNAEERDLIVAALRNSAPQETRGDEPVAWRWRTRPEDNWGFSTTRLSSNDIGRTSPTFQEVPLYAAPQQSPWLKREEIAEAGLRHAVGLSAHLEKSDWKPGRAHIEQARNTIQKLAGLLLIRGPMVPWELECQRHICAAPECECPAVSSTLQGEGQSAPSDQGMRVSRIPEGWLLVPRVPTPEMRAAFQKANDEYENGDGGWSPDHQWQAMLSAIPTVPSKTQGAV